MRIPIWIRITFITIAAFILVVYPLLLNIWLEHDSDGFFSKINGFYTKDIPLIFVLIIASIAIYAYAYIYRQWQESENNYEQELEQKGKILINKYNEIKNFQIMKVVSQTLETYCKNHTVITAAQIYNYSKTPLKNNIEVKINYVDGYVKEGINLNGMIQNNYHINKQLYKRYHTAKERFLNNENDYGLLLAFIFEAINSIGNLNIDDIDESTAIEYAYMIDLYTLLLQFYPNTEEIYIDEDKRDKLEMLMHENRYGILRGIELELFFEFSYNGSGEKEGRQYITRPITLLNDTHILLITVDPDLVSDEHQTFNELINQFEEMLNEEFNGVF